METDAARNCEKGKVGGTAQTPLGPQKNPCGKNTKWGKRGNKEA